LIARLDYKAKNKIDYVLFTATNSLAVLNANWNIEFYKVFSGTKKANTGNKDFLKQFVPATYKEFLGRGNNYLSSSQALEKAIPQNLYEKILQDFTTGDYDEKEIEYIQRINAELEDILAEYSVSDWNYTTKNLSFAKDRNYELQIISLMTKTGTIDFTQKLSTLLKKENDLTMLRNFISLISSVKFDYNETLVKALDNIVRVKLKNDDVTTHKLVCDALYDLSAFMGKDYFVKNVSQILTQLFYPQYDEQIKAYARETLLKISSP
jgi:hypothetical protein